MTSRFSLHLLGATSLSEHRGGSTESLLGPGKPLALLTFLALAPRRTVLREQFIELLWADSDPEMARRSLRQALYQARRRMGDEAILGDDEQLTLVADLTTDRDEFLEALDAGDPARAVALYQGPFFPAFAAPGGAAFEQWADYERERLQFAFFQALESLARTELRQHRWRDALRLARRLRESDRERESAWRLVLEALVSAGDWVQAAAEAEALEAKLREEGRTADPATTAMLRTARQTVPARAATSTRLVTELVGREAEFSTLIAGWQMAPNGLRRAHVSGAAGIGKTRLLRDVAARILATGGRAVMIRAAPTDHDLPWALAGDLTRQIAALPGAAAVAPAVAAVLLGLDPSLSSRFPMARAPATSGEEELLRLRTLAIADLLIAVADESPVALLIDDLHWSDAISRRLLQGLANRVSASAILLVTASRPGPEGTVLDRPEEVITLRPLTPEQVGVLVESIAQLPEVLRDSGFTCAIHDATHGSPLLVLETLQLALDRGWLSREDECWVAPDCEALLAALARERPLVRRVERLEPVERQLLRRLAIAGRPLPDALLGELFPREQQHRATVLAALEERGLAARAGSAWELAHDLMAEAVLSGITEEELRAAHAAMAEALLAGVRGGHARRRDAGPHLALAGDHAALAREFRIYVREKRNRGERDDPVAIAGEFLRRPTTDREVQELVASLPLSVRLGGYRAGARAIVVVALALVAALFWLSRPVRLVVTSVPRFGLQLAAGQPLVAEIRDRMGRTVGIRDSVRLSLGTGATDYGLIGQEWAKARSGRVVFDGVRFKGTYLAMPAGFITLRVSAPGLPVVETDTIVMGGRAIGLWLDRGTINGQQVDGEHRAVTVKRGTRLTGSVKLRYTTSAGTAAILSAVIPTWGDRERNFLIAKALASVAERDTFTLQLTMQGPAAPGRYRLIFIEGMETEARFLASGTNWLLGSPRWHDGNDAMDLTPAQLAEMDSTGSVDWLWDQPAPDGDSARAFAEMGSRAMRLPRALPREAVRRLARRMSGTTLEVVVE